MTRGLAVDDESEPAGWDVGAMGRVVGQVDGLSRIEDIVRVVRVGAVHRPGEARDRLPEEPALALAVAVKGRLGPVAHRQKDRDISGPPVTAADGERHFAAFRRVRIPPLEVGECCLGLCHGIDRRHGHLLVGGSATRNYLTLRHPLRSRVSQKIAPDNFYEQSELIVISDNVRAYTIVFTCCICAVI